MSPVRRSRSRRGLRVLRPRSSGASRSTASAHDPRRRRSHPRRLLVDRGNARPPPRPRVAVADLLPERLNQPRVRAVLEVERARLNEVHASRARIVAAADEERRRVVRDLHDGAQQRLVHTVITLKLASEALGRDQQPASGLVAEALEHAERANVELRELAHGILPAVLTRGGLRSAVEALATRMPVTVKAAVSADRLPAPVEATAYFVVAEALTNVAKHAHATGVTVRARVEDSTLRLEVRDDGVGGIRPDGGGLVGLADRLAAVDGRLRFDSPSDGGTIVVADIPIPGFARD